jgi:type I restriction enzyme M protein
MTKEQLKDLEEKLWKAADKLRADSDLKASEYSTPILGLIFLRFASIRFNQILPEIEKEFEAKKGKRDEETIESIALRKCGFYLPQEARYEYLMSLPNETKFDEAIKNAMQLIEDNKPELQGTLPKDEYFRLTRRNDNTKGNEAISLPKSLLNTFAEIKDDVTGDVFGKIYEYFLTEFASSEGQGGGEFFTPPSIVKLMVEIMEPYRGTIYDPACGSGGMFVQSSYFIDRRREELHDDDSKDLSVYGTEKTAETVKLAKMNLVINGIRGEIKQANAYYENPFDSYGKFDYVMANPPFNVDEVSLDAVESDKRFNEFGIPQNKGKASGKDKDQINTVPNANYLWINLFATSLKPKGRAALVMANSASDARNSEAEIRKRLIQEGVIDTMLTLPKSMFYTVSLPATLWFFDKSKVKKENPTVLFIDARNIFVQVSRSLREFTDEHIQNIATIERLYRGENQRLPELIKTYQQKADDFETQHEASAKHLEALQDELDEMIVDAVEDKTQKAQKKLIEEAEQATKKLLEQKNYFLDNIKWLRERFPNGVYEDVTGLCKVATLAEIEEQDWSLNPGRYVGVVIEEDGLTETEFKDEMKDRHQRLETLNNKADQLKNTIQENLKSLL